MPGPYGNPKTKPVGAGNPASTSGRTIGGGNGSGAAGSGRTIGKSGMNK